MAGSEEEIFDNVFDLDASNQANLIDYIGGNGINLDLETLDYDGWSSDGERDEMLSSDLGAAKSSKTVQEAMQLLVPEVQEKPRRSRGKYGRRKFMTADEKAELTRQRNRENARTTRKRRKMYIKKLQRVVHMLKSHQQNTVTPTDAKEESSIQEQRTRNVLRFFEIRENGIVDKDKWLRVVSPEIHMSTPVTSYESASSSEWSRGSLRVLEGVSAVIQETAFLKNYLIEYVSKKEGRLSNRPDGVIKYCLNPSDFVMVGDTLMCDWRMTMNHDECKNNKGVNKVSSLSLVGMCKCKFAVDHRICAIDLRFDSMGFTRLLEDFGTRKMRPVPSPADIKTHQLSDSNAKLFNPWYLAAMDQQNVLQANLHKILMQSASNANCVDDALHKK